MQKHIQNKMNEVVCWVELNEKPWWSFLAFCGRLDVELIFMSSYAKSNTEFVAFLSGLIEYGVCFLLLSFFPFA